MCNFSNFFDLKILEKIIYFFQKFITVINPFHKEFDMADKPHLNLIVTGHIDNGKSTTMGHFLMDLGLIDERTIAQHAAESEKTGKGDTFKYAWVMDNIKDERERGITIDLAFQKFESAKYFFTLIDAPGHRDFIKNMITGASEADCAVLVLSAKEGETDTAIAPGGQAREHAFLLKTLGVGQLIVAINKMDAADYKEDAFKSAKDKAEKLVKSVGYKLENVPIIPISGWKGDNPEKPVGKPLRVPIQDVYTITGVGTVPVGRVETGKMKANDKVIIMPSGVIGEIKSIETHHTQMQSAEAGDNIGFNLRGIEKKDIKRGDVLGTPDAPPKVAKEFKAQIIVIHHPTAIAPGYTPVMHAHTAQVAATITEFESKINPATGAVEEQNPKFLKVGDSAIVKIRPVRPTCIETFKDFPELGRFALRDMGATIAAGFVKEITEEQKP